MEYLKIAVVLLSLSTVIKCTPYDNGKYKHKTYDFYDDGKYYRPSSEGKYIPGDEGKYTYIYQKGVWPYDGTYKHLEVGDNEYQIYAPRFPYAVSIIRALTSLYESPDILTLSDFGDKSPNYYGKYQTHKENQRKSNYVEKSKQNKEEVNPYFPPLLKIQEGEKLGTVYNYKGTKILNTMVDSKKNKVKLEYEVFLRLVDNVRE